MRFRNKRLRFPLGEERDPKVLYETSEFYFHCFVFVHCLSLCFAICPSRKPDEKKVFDLIKRVVRLRLLQRTRALNKKNKQTNKRTKKKKKNMFVKVLRFAEPSLQL